MRGSVIPGVLRWAAALPTAVAVCALLISVGCSAPDREGFAIYLTEEDIPPARMAVLSHVRIAEHPIIAPGDIVKYDAVTHEITLTEGAFARVAGLDVPTGGRSFVVCLGRAPVYSGAFWLEFSSTSFDGVTIMKPLDARGPRVIRIGLGYPSPSFYKGDDPRDNADLMKSLKQAGKLTAGASPTVESRLPHSLKGYELYSWAEGGQWYFTLITGTNRNKTYEEILSAASTISYRDGWVRIRVTGVDAVKDVLTRLPREEHVIWMGGWWGEPAPTGAITAALPPAAMVDAVERHAGDCGLRLVITR